MPYLSLLHPEPLSLWQTTTNLYLHRRQSNTVLPQSLWVPWVLVCTRFVWALWASMVGMGFDYNLNLPLLQYCWGFPFAIGCGVFPHSHSSTYRLPGVFLTLTWGISPQSLNTAVWCCSAMQPPLTAHTSEQDTVFPSLSLSHQEAFISFFSLTVKGQNENHNHRN